MVLKLLESPICSFQLKFQLQQIPIELLGNDGTVYN